MAFTGADVLAFGQLEIASLIARRTQAEMTSMAAASRVMAVRRDAGKNWITKTHFIA